MKALRAKDVEHALQHSRGARVDEDIAAKFKPGAEARYAGRDMDEDLLFREPGEFLNGLFHGGELAVRIEDVELRFIRRERRSVVLLQLLPPRGEQAARAGDRGGATRFGERAYGLAGAPELPPEDYGRVYTLLQLGNSPRAIAPWGGRAALFGTNPIAFAAPRPGAAPLVVDLSLSKVARGRIMVAAREGRPIPEGWALDADGRPTTDAGRAMAGTMLPIGEAKGAALVLMVEILAAALTGAHFGYEASSFFEAEGAPPGVGQLVIAIAPAGLSGGAFGERLEALLAAIERQSGARLPGARRLERRARARAEGVPVARSLHDEIRAIAEGDAVAGAGQGAG